MTTPTITSPGQRAPFVDERGNITPVWFQALRDGDTRSTTIEGNVAVNAAAIVDGFVLMSFLLADE